MSDYPPNVPAKLVTKLQECGSLWALAHEIGINSRYVYDLFKRGVEPPYTNQDARRALGLRLRPPRPKRKRRPAVWDDAREFEIQTRR